MDRRVCMCTFHVFFSEASFVDLLLAKSARKEVRWSKVQVGPSGGRHVAVWKSII